MRREVFLAARFDEGCGEVLGNGGLGSTDKAVMTNGVAVVVKRMKDMNKLGKDGFGMELRRLRGLHHRNILTPLAYHYRKEEKLVVNEIRSHQKEQTGQRFERYPMSPNFSWRVLVEGKGVVGFSWRLAWGYELRTNAGGCNRLLCWKKTKHNNKGKISWLFRKVGTDDDKGFQCYLANVQYKLKDSEKTIREGFVKIGRIETTKEFIAKLDLKTGQKVLGGGCGIGGGDFYMPDNFGVMISFNLERVIGCKCFVEFNVTKCMQMLR
ncbi:hypothetical protein IFM89_003499 [Coptis chinensis]|uniref:phosphoethanolamine N-methyltransferase n=1 Tax=Coptis chinensis TaxID=261450 RepID=A0A835HCK2_9MAGN|nr:hypothetical protein IFM89_003499 [Coptis chinensis]